MSLSTPTGDATRLLPYLTAIRDAAARYGVDPVILGSIILHESSGVPGVVNPTSGASGLTQVLPSAHPEYDLARLRGTTPADVQYQIDAGARILARYQQQTPGNMTAALARYAGGDIGGRTYRDILISDYAPAVRTLFGAPGGGAGGTIPRNPALIGILGLPGISGIPGPPNPLGGAQDVLTAIRDVLRWITDPDNWVAIALALVGLALVVLGLASALGRNETVQQAGQTAALAAAAA